MLVGISLLQITAKLSSVRRGHSLIQQIHPTNVLYKKYIFLIKKIIHVYCTNFKKNLELYVVAMLVSIIKMLISILFLKYFPPHIPREQLEFLFFCT